MPKAKSNAKRISGLVVRVPRPAVKPLSYRMTIREGYSFTDNGEVPQLWKRMLLRLVGWKIEVLEDRVVRLKEVS